MVLSLILPTSNISIYGIIVIALPDIPVGTRLQKNWVAEYQVKPPHHGARSSDGAVSVYKE